MLLCCDMCKDGALECEGEQDTSEAQENDWFDIEGSEKLSARLSSTRARGTRTRNTTHGESSNNECLMRIPRMLITQLAFPIDWSMLLVTQQKQTQAFADGDWRFSCNSLEVDPYLGMNFSSEYRNSLNSSKKQFCAFLSQLFSVYHRVDSMSGWIAGLAPGRAVDCPRNPDSQCSSVGDGI